MLRDLLVCRNLTKRSQEALRALLEDAFQAHPAHDQSVERVLPVGHQIGAELAALVHLRTPQHGGVGQRQRRGAHQEEPSVVAFGVHEVVPELETNRHEERIRLVLLPIDREHAVSLEGLAALLGLRLLLRRGVAHQATTIAPLFVPEKTMVAPSLASVKFTEP